jgi:putative hydrolase of the HAD superfamily
LKINNIRHIFFDLDHTLWDFDKNSALTFERIFKLHGVNVPLQQFLEVYEPINLQYWKLYREEKISKPDLRYRRLRDAFDLISYYPEDQVIHELSHLYIEHLTSINHLFEGTVDLLHYLKQTYQLHIITNGFEEAQSRKLKNSKIELFFSTVTNSEMVGVKKPHPRIFNFALEAAGARAEESLMVGDSIEADMEGAKNVGMQTVLFDYKNTSKKYQNTKINNLAELKTIL